MLRHLDNEFFLAVCDLNSIEKLRQLFRLEPYVKHRTYNLYNCSDVFY
jgi:hypothetical protein